jgi:hypothetical protein
MLLDEKIEYINKCFQGCLVKRGHRQRALNIYDDVLLFLQNHIEENPMLLYLKL